ncbi:MAG: DNA mismatch repair endonuclease MutL [Gammaproteobacteria bacterium]|nr:DNA mismatch repair endonuclease MutL [Gammaproteobacteria bacterium]
MAQRIHQLDNQLANQIAAGEVVERPASVVKELLENSVDAGATRIDVDIERGGARLIRIIDNGQGIHKDDLPLALSRHATSKIASFNDLCAVKTMGFRGEALASIASISRLSLRTRQQGDELGWQAQTEGREMAVKVTPVAATEGTCLEVRDLFFNTPARRKFLRTEKTEFAHIEDVVKRTALANPKVAIVLKHNNKVIKRFPASSEYKVMHEKVTAACSRNFVANSHYFEGELDEVRIFGWLGHPSFHRSESDNQFIFINQRAVKDRLLSHAIRQSYSERLPMGRFASYIIFIECPVTEVDVNVHPTKHEVRFRNPRFIHDFLVKLLQQCLSAEGDMISSSSPATVSNIFTHSQATKSGNGRNDYRDNHGCLSLVPSGDNSKNNSDSNNDSESIVQRQGVGRLTAKLTSINEKSALYESTVSHESLYSNTINGSASNFSEKHHSKYDDEVVDLTKRSKSAAANGNLSVSFSRFSVQFEADKIWLIDFWQWLLRDFEEKLIASSMKPLLIPKVIDAACPDLENPELFDAFLTLGIEITPAGDQQVMIRKLPLLDFQISFELWQKVLCLLLSQPLPTENAKEVAERLHQLFLKQSDLLSQQEWMQLRSAYDVRKVTPEEWRKYALEISHDYLLKHLGRSL